MAKLSIDKRLQILSEHLIRARIHYDLWWFLEGEDTYPKIRDTLNKFPEFFLVDTNAHFVSLSIRCGVVWDKTKNTISLPRIDRDILDPTRCNLHKGIQTEISCLEKASAGILNIRHGAIAHVSDSKGRMKIFSDENIIPNELPKMMADWLAVTNKLRQIVGLVEVEFRAFALRDLQKLVHRLGGPDFRPKTRLDDIFET